MSKVDTSFARFLTQQLFHYQLRDPSVDVLDKIQPLLNRSWQQALDHCLRVEQMGQTTDLTELLEEQPQMTLSQTNQAVDALYPYLYFVTEDVAWLVEQEGETAYAPCYSGVQADDMRLGMVDFNMWLIYQDMDPLLFQYDA